MYGADQHREISVETFGLTISSKARLSNLNPRRLWRWLTLVIHALTPLRMFRRFSERLPWRLELLGWDARALSMCRSHAPLPKQRTNGDTGASLCCKGPCSACPQDELMHALLGNPLLYPSTYEKVLAPTRRAKAPNNEFPALPALSLGLRKALHRLAHLSVCTPYPAGLQPSFSNQCMSPSPNLQASDTANFRSFHLSASSLSIQHLRDLVILRAFRDTYRECLHSIYLQL